MAAVGSSTPFLVQLFLILVNLVQLDFNIESCTYRVIEP